MKVWLDDERLEPPGWKRAYSYMDAISFLVDGNVTEISLDHDLGGFSGKTGYDVAKWIAEMAYEGKETPIVYVHTQNPVGRDNIVQLLEHYGVEVRE